MYNIRGKDKIIIDINYSNLSKIMLTNRTIISNTDSGSKTRVYFRDNTILYFSFYY